MPRRCAAMMRAPILALLALAACDGGVPAAPAAPEPASIPQPSGPPAPQNLPDPVPPAAPVQPGGWESAASGEGIALRLTAPGGKLVMSIACLGDPVRLSVAVPGFTPIGSEDRFALALGEEPATLVAGPTRQSEGVTAEGPVPETFADAFGEAAQIGALYGTQRVGPAPPPPDKLARLLIEACSA